VVDAVGDERLELMCDHIEPTLEYLDRVRRQLYHSSGLDDHDFITYFETDDLVAFHDLYRELQTIPEYRYVDYGDPTLVGRIHEPATAVAKVTQTPVR
jgi:chlorite dismutase